MWSPPRLLLPVRTARPGGRLSHPARTAAARPGCRIPGPPRGLNIICLRAAQLCQLGPPSAEWRLELELWASWLCARPRTNILYPTRVPFKHMLNLPQAYRIIPTKNIPAHFIACTLVWLTDWPLFLQPHHTKEHAGKRVPRRRALGPACHSGAAATSPAGPSPCCSKRFMLGEQIWHPDATGLQNKCMHLSRGCAALAAAPLLPLPTAAALPPGPAPPAGAGTLRGARASGRGCRPHCSSELCGSRRSAAGCAWRRSRGRHRLKAEALSNLQNHTIHCSHSWHQEAG